MPKATNWKGKERVKNEALGNSIFRYSLSNTPLPYHSYLPGSRIEADSGDLYTLSLFEDLFLLTSDPLSPRVGQIQLQHYAKDHYF